MRLLTSTLVAAFALMLIGPAAHADVPTEMNVQGRLTDSTGAPVASANPQFDFSIWDAAVSGTQIWPSSGTESQSLLTDGSGLWNARVGSSIPLTPDVFADSARWLQITVDDGGGPIDLPRVKLNTSPYAYRAASSQRADTADAVAGLVPGPYLPLTGGTMSGAISSTGDPDITMGRGNFGTTNTLTGNWGFVAGSNNTVSGQFATSPGGTNNTADYTASTVGGGASNAAHGDFSTIAGGGANSTLPTYSTIGGGANNAVNGSYGTIGGGELNQANGQRSFVGGGRFNRATSPLSVIGGGDSNTVEVEWGTIAGGARNRVQNFSWGAIGGGKFNTTAGEAATVAGGYNNGATAIWSTIAGGFLNTAADSGSAVLSGFANLATGAYSTVTGGRNNRATGYLAFVGGGGGTFTFDSNSAGGAHAAVVGGRSNTAPGDEAAVVGGAGNYAGFQGTFVGAGSDNAAAQLFASVVGGTSNQATGNSAFIGGGNDNQATNFRCSVVGGINNLASGSESVIGGGNANRAAGQYSVVGGGGGPNVEDSNSAPGVSSTVPGGRQNMAGGRYSFAAGRHARALEDGSFVWADSTDADFNSVYPNEFAIRATNGLRVVANSSAYGGISNNTGVGDGFRAYGNTSQGINWAALYAHNTGTSPAVYGYSTAGPAAYFDGDVTITGTLSKGAGAFKIDHPLDPQNKYLLHSFVESPDMKDVYDGVATLDANGEAWVDLPDWFEALNRDFRYQLTCIGGYAPVYISDKIADNRFRIAGGKAGLEVSWQVTGIRQDAYANAHRIPVEEDKAPDERGKYLHPEAFGFSKDAGIASGAEKPAPTMSRK